MKKNTYYKPSLYIYYIFFYSLPFYCIRMHSIAQSFTNIFLNFFSISFHSSPKQSFYNPYYNPPLRRPPQFDQFSFITFASSALAFAFAAICCNFVRCGAFPSVSANLMGSPSSPPLPLFLSPSLPCWVSSSPLFPLSHPGVPLSISASNERAYSICLDTNKTKRQTRR